MGRIVEAIYEDGVLKLEQPLPLKNQERMRVTVERLDRRAHSVLDICFAEGDAPLLLGRDGFFDVFRITFDKQQLSNGSPSSSCRKHQSK